MLTFRILPLLGCAILATSPAWAQSPLPASHSAALLRQLGDGFAQVFEKTAPSVVVIDVAKKNVFPEGDPGEASEGLDSFFRAPDAGLRAPLRRHEPSTRGEGSGFVVRPDGFIVTNSHVIAGAEKISVKLKDGRQFPAKVIGTDEVTDIAVIKIAATGLPAAAWGDSDKLRIGELVCAIGVPFALEYSFTIGCVSGKGRSGLTPEATPCEDYIQTSALINPGNSGGPLIDVDGRVVGMNTLVNGLNRSLAFAVPAKMLQEVSTQLIETGRAAHPALGIRIETLGADSSLREQIQGVEKGVVITTIEPNTAAYKSDLRPADVITAIDGTPVATAQELRRQVLSKKVGQPIVLTVWRGGKALKIQVTPGEMAAPKGALPAGSAPGPGISESACGLHLGDAKEDKQRPGAVVTAVDPGSPAAIAGIQRDDILTEIDGKPVTDSAAARKLLESHEGAKALLLFIERKGQKTYAVVKIEK